MLRWLRTKKLKKTFVVFKQETLLLDAMFEVPGSDVKTVHITEDCVKGLCPPEYITHTVDDKSQTNSATATEEEESAQVRVKQ